MLVLHPGLFHVERFSQGFSRAESPARSGWAGKRPGGSQRPPPRRSPPRHIMGPEADEEPSAADAWLRMQRDSSGMWAALRIDSREPAALPAGALSLAASVLCLPAHLLLLRLLCRSVFALCHGSLLVGPAPGEDLLPVAGEIWVDLQEAFPRVA